MSYNFKNYFKTLLLLTATSLLASQALAKSDQKPQLGTEAHPFIISILSGKNVDAKPAPQLGTENNPLVTKMIPEARDDFWQRTVDDPVALFTFVLAVSTIGLWVVT